MNSPITNWLIPIIICNEVRENRGSKSAQLSTNFIIIHNRNAGNFMMTTTNKGGNIPIILLNNARN